MVILLLVGSIAAAQAFGLGRLGARFGGLGAVAPNAAAIALPCPSPTAPNGVVDLSVCSNAYYVALIF